MHLYCNLSGLEVSLCIYAMQPVLVGIQYIHLYCNLSWLEFSIFIFTATCLGWKSIFSSLLQHVWVGSQFMHPYCNLPGLEVSICIYTATCLGWKSVYSSILQPVLVGIQYIERLYCAENASQLCMKIYCHSHGETKNEAVSKKIKVPA